MGKEELGRSLVGARDAQLGMVRDEGTNVGGTLEERASEDKEVEREEEMRACDQGEG